MHVAAACLTLILAILLLPESPRFHYSQNEFETSREGLRQVARFNGVRRVPDFTFDTEIQDPDANESEKKDAKNEYGIS